MIKEGICVFSGHEVLKGSGIVRVTNDSKFMLFKNKKVLSLSRRKINPRLVKWTQPSRMFLKKGSKKAEKKFENVQIVKEFRGFPMIPKSMIKNFPSKEPKKDKKEIYSSKNKNATEGAKNYARQNKIVQDNRRMKR